MSAFPKEYKVIVFDEGELRACWLNGGKLLHNEDGPAVEFTNGDVEYRQNGKLHRVDGPAIVCVDGHKEWYRYDLLHNEEGPAVVYAETGYGGVKVGWSEDEYWLEGMEYEMEEWVEELDRRLDQYMGFAKKPSKRVNKQTTSKNETRDYCELEDNNGKVVAAGHPEAIIAAGRLLFDMKSAGSDMQCSGCKQTFNKNDLHEYTGEYVGFRGFPYCLKCWPYPHAQTANPNPPKHPYCGECGLATAYLYTPNPCKSCGISKPETIQFVSLKMQECHICHEFFDESNICLRDGYYWCNGCYRKEPHCLGYMCRNLEVSCRCPCIRCCHACGVDCGASWCKDCVKFRQPAPKRLHCLNYTCLKKPECECPCSICVADKALIASITDNRPAYTPTKKNELEPLTMSCWGCSTKTSIELLTFPAAWKEHKEPVGYCQRCIEELGDLWESVLTGGTGVPMKPAPYYNGGPCNYCGHKEPVACKLCGMFSCPNKDACKLTDDHNRRKSVINEQPENNRRSVVQPAVKIDPATTRTCCHCHHSVSIDELEACMEGWICRDGSKCCDSLAKNFTSTDYYKAVGALRTCDYCDQLCDSKDAMKIANKLACQKCHRGMTLAAVS